MVASRFMKPIPRLGFFDPLLDRFYPELFNNLYRNLDFLSNHKVEIENSFSIMAKIYSLFRLMLYCTILLLCDLKAYANTWPIFPGSGTERNNVLIVPGGT